MVWDAGNEVGLNKSHFPVYYCCSVQFCNPFIEDFGRLPLGPVLGEPHRSAGAQQELSSAIEGPILPHFVGVSHQDYQVSLDPITLWLLNHSWAFVGDLCPFCFGLTEVATMRASD